MAERTLVEIQDNAGAPSWVTGTEEEAYVKFISVHGPFKTETLLFQQEASNTFKADDVVKSSLAHPLFVTCVATSDRGNITEAIASAEVNSDESNANFKDITLRDGEGNAGFGICITVYGF